MDGAEAVELTTLEHLHELARRLLWSVGFLLFGGVVAYVFRLQIINFLQRPLHETLYYTSPMGSFQFIMQVCLLSGVLCALPVLLYNVLKFIEPAFSKSFSRRMVLTLLGASLTLTLAGVAFGYYVTLPVALRFFGAVGTSELRPLISVNEYFSFILGYLGTFALVFQIPLILLFIDHIHPINPSGLRKKRTIVYVGAFAVSLIMPSSPDPLSQVSLAIPIIVLYELSILLIVRQDRKRRKPTAEIHYSPLIEADELSQYSDMLAELPRIGANPSNILPTVTPEQRTNTVKRRGSIDGINGPRRFARPVKVTQTSSKLNNSRTGGNRRSARIISDIF